MYKKCFGVGLTVLLSLSMGILGFSKDTTTSSIELTGSIQAVSDNSILESDSCLDVDFESGSEPIFGGEEQEKALGSGTLANGLKWTIKNTGKLVIEVDASVTAEEGMTLSYSMKDYSSASKTPWYSLRDSITLVEVKAGVTTIGNNAFAGLTKVTEVTTPDSLTRIGQAALKSCTSLTKITLQEGLEIIDESAFEDCNKLSKFYTSGAAHAQDETKNCLPKSVSTLGKDAFLGCISLKKMEVTQNDLFKENDVDAGFGKYVKDGEVCKMDDFILYTLGGANDFTNYRIKYARRMGINYKPVPYNGKLGENVNWELSEDGTLTITGTGCINIADETLRRVQYRQSDVKRIVISPGIISIGEGALQNLRYASEISIPDGLVSIEEKGLLGLKSITKIVLPDSVEMIGASAFMECEKLETVNAPKNLSSIGTMAFAGCSSLKSFEVPDGVKKLEGFTFYSCSSLEEIALSKGLLEMGDGCFGYCSSLKEIVIPDQIKILGGFSYCNSLEKVILPKDLTYISPNAFSYCTSLKEIELPEGLLIISSLAFKNCKSLSQVYLPEGVRSIYEDAFYNCPSLTEVYIPQSVTSIDNNTCFGTFVNDEGVETKMKEFRILGEPESYAQEYANEVGFTFVPTHRWDNGEVSTTPSCLLEGKMVYHCIHCNVTKEETIKAQGHLFASDYMIDVEPTCEAEGLKSRHCERQGCNASIDSIRISPLGHSMKLSADGKTMKCEHCAYKILEETKRKDNTSGFICKVTSVKKKQVCIVGVINKKKTTISIPKTVLLDGIKYNVTEIGNKAFKGNKRIKKVKIPASITKIGKSAFQGCKNLKTIQIKTKKLKVNKIGKNAFKGISSKATVTVPKKKKKLYKDFLKKSGLTGKKQKVK